jgi:hypothetical protein
MSVTLDRVVSNATTTGRAWLVLASSSRAPITAEPAWLRGSSQALLRVDPSSCPSAPKPIPKRADPERIARSLLIKRNAFQHEAEVSIVYQITSGGPAKNDLFPYPVDPHALID